MVEVQVPQNGLMGQVEMIGYCAVCIAESKLMGTYRQDIVLVDAYQCTSPIHSSLLVDKKVCPVCGRKVSSTNAHGSRSKYCSVECANKHNQEHPNGKR